VTEVRISGGISVTVVGHSDGPVPANILEAIELWTEASGSIDRDALRGAIQDELRGLPYVLDEFYKDFSWGASGASLGFVLHVPALISNVAGIL